MPASVRVAAAKANGSGIADNTFEEEAGFLRSYAVFLVQAARLDAEGRTSFLAAAQFADVTSVTDGKGRPLPRVVDPSPKLEILLAALRAGIKAQPGSEHMEVLVFDNKDASGQPILQAKQPGAFAIHIRGVAGATTAQMTWQTPIPTLAEVAKCSTCGSALQAGWNYCPICGQPVKAK